MVARLRDAVTFQPLKDLRFASSAMQGNTWFMSSLNDTIEGEESEYLYFPSEAHQGRLLCITGNDTHDGGNNKYALAWPDSLPQGAKVLDGLTYVSSTYYDYSNIWHGLSAMLPFVGWYENKGCAAPSSWVLYHWGEVRVGMVAWLRTLMEATFGEEAMKIETFERSQITCFEKAVVFRHDAGRMPKHRRMEVFDMLRCKARAYCNVTRDDVLKQGKSDAVPLIGLTLFLRTGDRSFKNESTVIQIFEKTCGKIQGCRLSIAHSNNLTFCEQVKLMSSTDVLVSTHGAQLTNMFFMDRNSSVMEFFPKGWKEVAGPGQYVYHWEANWSGMRHQGAWRDPDGEDCPSHVERLQCFFFYKNGRVGHNESYFTEWTLNVLNQVKDAKIEQPSLPQTQYSSDLLEATAGTKVLSRQKGTSFFFTAMKICVFALITLVPILLFFQSQSLRPQCSYNYPLSSFKYSSRWGVFQHLGLNGLVPTNCTNELRAMLTRLRDAVTFQPLKDLRFASTAMQGNTWFMSSLNDTSEGDESEYLYFPSEDHRGRLLCIKGHDTHDGGKNMYALAWPDTLPPGATVLNGLTYVSDTYYDYGNIWHGLSAMLPFVGWYEYKGCAAPSRWVLYHWGEVRVGMGTWLRTLMEATFGEQAMKIESLERSQSDQGAGVTCFENAVVFRHNTGRMTRQRRIQVFDILRCKARAYCNVTIREIDDPLLKQGKSADAVPFMGLTLLLRSGARSFKNESTVIQIFEKACGKIHGCRFSVARSDNLTFCEQVKLMSHTDVLVSSHGAQLTNMFFMDRNSSVMEFFPKGWKELAGAGQYVYHWEANWSGMRHQGAWRDPNGEECPPSLQGRECFSVYKNGKVGHNETYFTEWTLDVLNQVKVAKIEQAASHALTRPSEYCPCST
ncbi:hypothetical protein H6P81_010730 [Aristolochia fimbriata]|uniref:Glycosyltransferase 61 catalytic domain-containing protein n=1 Tax=Aristolochia fimbriata TaxID=158543 RepID=A0AAV7EPL1_ARIFI|nr:hypothetical protein H6P81_010730 [Aristolochia fimbriata]